MGWTRSSSLPERRDRSEDRQRPDRRGSPDLTRRVGPLSPFLTSDVVATAERLNQTVLSSHGEQRATRERPELILVFAQGPEKPLRPVLSGLGPEGLQLPTGGCEVRWTRPTTRENSTPGGEARRSPGEPVEVGS